MRFFSGNSYNEYTKFRLDAIWLMNGHLKDTNGCKIGASRHTKQNNESAIELQPNLLSFPSSGSLYLRETFCKSEEVKAGLEDFLQSKPTMWQIVEQLASN